MMSFIICTPYQILSRLSLKKTDIHKACDTWRTGQVHTWFWWGNLKQRNHLEITGIDGKIILKWILKAEDGRVWCGFIWLKIGTSVRFLLTR